MTASEAIHKIKEHNRIHRLNERNAIFITKAFNMAVEALEKQIPKKPTDIKSWEFDRLKCGICCICNTGVNSDMKYCDNCGQILDWSDEEND